MNLDAEFWSRQRVLLTGHTGFKGTWLSLWLEKLGVQTTGLALAPDTDPSLFELIQPKIDSVIGDIRDLDTLHAVVARARPTIVIHMAAQPLVRYSYREPIETMASNVMGTANLLQALRGAVDLRAAVIVTTDKVYANAETGRAFKEDDPLGGHDPYSASKAAAEIITRSFADSFFAQGAPIATARGGNVVGGGDWAPDRILPDIWRAIGAGMPVQLRNPKATRPWQHVLELVGGYMFYAQRLAEDSDLPRALNFGPAIEDALNVAQVTDLMLAEMGSAQGWELTKDAQPREMQALALDPSLAARTLGWRSRLRGAEAVRWSAQWYRGFNAGKNARDLCLQQIDAYRQRISA
jgi:CDP-glucose 4,6-dehydratase